MIQTNTLVKAQKITSFKRSLAVVIGINDYQNKIPKLQTARCDAEVLAQILAKEHQYDEVILMTDETECKPTLKNLLTLLEEKLPKEIQLTKDDRLLFYFAGHGIARDSDKGPAGCLVPQDADLENNKNLLPMQKLHECLSALSCRHLLVILDCCFAGTFRWSTARLATVIPTVIRKEHYDRFIKSPAWQAITSAAHNQEALDILRDNRGGNKHSPFAEALFKALRGEGDVIPAAKNGKAAGDGVISATELYLYLRDHVETASNESQTPGIWTLSKHDRGEYIFLVPGADPKLKPAPKLTEKNNPYRGLQSFEEEHSQLFFGRKELVKELYDKISNALSSLTVVLGISGSGKSSLVKAGLIPYLRQNHQKWYILKPMRPSESPFTALARTLLLITNNNDIVVSKQLDNLHFIDEILQQEITALNQRIDECDENTESDEILQLEQKVKNYERIADNWKRAPKEAKQRLIVDHFDDINNLCRDNNERTILKEAVLDCLNPLSNRLQDPNEFIKIIKTWSEQRPGIKLLLVIDQFEELITLSSQSKEDKENKQPNLTASQQFLKLLEAILAAHIPQLRIVVTLRSDFEPRFLNSEALKSYWTHARFPVRAMRSDELRQAIERPAAEMALYFEQLPGERNPVDKLVDEVGQMPGALPLLSFTLSELYIKLAKKWVDGESSDRALKLDAEFDKEGGVAGSLTRRANKEYNSLPDDKHRDTMRRVMLRMVTIEGGESARRRVPLSELVYADKHDPSKPDDEENQRVELVLKRLNEARLIVSGQETGKPYVEPAHDFLVRSWDKLQKWQQEEQQNLPLQRLLTPAAEEWKSVTSKLQPSGLQTKAENVIDWLDRRLYVLENLFNKVSDLLIRRWQQRQNQQKNSREKPIQFLWNSNPYLDVLNQELQSNNNWFNQLEAEFIQKSVLQKRRNISWRWRIAIAVMLGLSGLTIATLIGQRSAQIQEIEALREASEANLVSDNQLDALLQSLRAGKHLKENQLLKLFPPDSSLQDEVIRTLRKVFYTGKESNRLELASEKIVGMFPSSDGKYLIATDNGQGTLSLWKLKNRQEKLAEFPGHKGEITVFFSPNGKQLATYDEVGKEVVIRLWDITSKKSLLFSSTIGYDKRRDFRFSPNGEQIAIVTKDNTFLWDWRNNRVYKFKESQAEETPVGIGFTKDGKILVATETGNIFDWSVSKQSALRNLKDFSDDILQVIFSPEGNQLLVSNHMHRCSFVQKYELSENTTPSELKEGCVIKYSPDGTKIAIGNEDGTIYLHDSRTGTLLQAEFKKVHQGEVTELSFSPDGKQLFSLGQDNIIKLFRLGTNKLDDFQLSGLKFTLQNTDNNQNALKFIGFRANTNQIISVQNNENIFLSTLSGKNELLLKTVPNLKNNIVSAVVSSDNNKIAIAREDNTIEMRNISSNKSSKRFQLPEGKKFHHMIFHPRNGNLIVVTEYQDMQSNYIDNQYITDVWYGVPFKNSTSKQILGQPIGLSFGSDGNLLVHTLQDMTGGGVRLETLNLDKQQRATIFDLTFLDKNITVSQDTHLMATATKEGTVKLWDFWSKQLLAEFQAHQTNIKSINFSSDNSWMITVGEDGITKSWRIGDLNDLLSKGCDRVRDYLVNLDENHSDRHLCDDIIVNSHP